MLKLLIPFIALLGLIFGHILSILAQEEIKPGKKYFRLAQKILLAILALVLIYASFPFSYVNLIFFCLGLFLAIFIKKIYLYIGLASFLSFYTPYLFLINSLILLFGLPYGTLLNKNKIPLAILLFIIPFSLYFLSDFVILYLPCFLSFSAAALVPKIFINSDN